MHPVDWMVVVAYLVYIVWDGLRRTRGTDKVEGYFLASRSLPWWAVGLSVMATQMSAVTLVGTTGQAYSDGLRFIQFYFGLPVAMVILSLTVVPFFHRAKVYTAYEYLEQRFDLKVRTLASLLFLLGRALSLGVTLSAPAVVLSVMLGWNLPLTVLAIGLPMIAYTMVGGVQAVAWTDVKQMFVIVTAVASAVVVLIVGIPHDVSFGQALHLAGATGRLQAIDFRFDLKQTYTFWSGLVGGLFLMLAYFGCDQSQVQRYLTAKSIDQARHSLLMSGFVKIPLQVLILMTGVLVFIFYLFQPPPMLFNRVHEAQLRSGPSAAEYAALERRFQQTFEARRTAAETASAARGAGDAITMAATQQTFLEADRTMAALRTEATTLVKKATGDQTYRDVNYVFPTFITTQMPIGLVGLMIAAIFAAGMSAAAGELNSLATATVIDFYRRLLHREGADAHYLLVSKLATLAWGVFACFVAMQAVSLGSLIEVVNRFGSIFYGSLLGAFVLAIGTRRATSNGAFLGIVAGMTVVLIVAFTTDLAFLWHNLIGAVVVVVVGMAVSFFEPAPAPSVP